MQAFVLWLSQNDPLYPLFHGKLLLDELHMWKAKALVGRQPVDEGAAAEPPLAGSLWISNQQGMFGDIGVLCTRLTWLLELGTSRLVAFQGDGK